MLNLRICWIYIYKYKKSQVNCTSILLGVKMYTHFKSNHNRYIDLMDL